MPQPEPPPQGAAKHLQEYFAGVAGIPPKEPAGQVSVVVHGDGPVQDLQRLRADDDDEVHRLRQLLHEKDHAMFKAVVSANDLRVQLEQARAESDSLKVELAQVLTKPEPESKPGALSPEAQEELNKQRREWLRIQKTLEAEHSQRKAELVQVRGQWFATQQQLEQETRARRAERAQASAKINSLERSLETANSTIASIGKEARRKGWRTAWMAVAASLLVAAGAGYAWTSFTGHTATAAGVASATVVKAASEPVTPLTSRPKLLPSLLAASGQKGFQGSLGRLNQALASFGNTSPALILKQVQAKSGDPTVCAFEWNDGQPSVIYNNPAKESLAASLNKCASAVEAFH
jgi:hypothetical protein